MEHVWEAGVGVEAGAGDGDGGGGGGGGGVGRGCFGSEADYYYSLGHFYELLWTKVRLARFVPTIQLSRETLMRSSKRREEERGEGAEGRGISNLCFICFSFLFLILNFLSLLL